MGAKIMTPQNCTLVPAAKGTFSQMFMKLREVPNLYTPMAPPPQSEGFKDPGVPVENPETAFYSYHVDDRRYTIVFTDYQIFKPGKPFIEVNTRKELTGIFEKDEVDGVIFNPPGDPDGEGMVFSHPTSVSFQVDSLGLARLVGLLMTPDPYAQAPETTHILNSEAGLLYDSPYMALFHAMEARDSGQFDIDDYAPLELDALVIVGLYQYAKKLYQWYADKGGCSPKMLLSYMRLLTLTGEAAKVPDLAAKYIGSTIFGHRACLETGRALHYLERNKEAIPYLYKACEKIEPRCVEAEFLLGIALRNVAMDESNTDIAQDALRWLGCVCENRGFNHSYALYFISTIYQRGGALDRAEAVLREGLKLRDDGLMWRDLVICLAKQKRMEEARKEAKDLLKAYPEHAKVIAKYGI